LEKRVRELEEENARLRANRAKGGEYSAREDTYNGSPVLVFERPSGKSFSLGSSKLTAIRICWHKVEEFLRKHGKAKVDSRPDPTSGDERI